MTKRKHVYEYDIDLNSDVAPARVIRMVKPGSKVLEIGAGHWTAPIKWSGLIVGVLWVSGLLGRGFPVRVVDNAARCVA